MDAKTGLTKTDTCRAVAARLVHHEPLDGLGPCVRAVCDFPAGLVGRGKGEDAELLAARHGFEVAGQRCGVPYHGRLAGAGIALDAEEARRAEAPQDTPARLRPRAQGAQTARG